MCNHMFLLRKWLPKTNTPQKHVEGICLNHLAKAISMNTHNICFCVEIRKIPVLCFEKCIFCRFMTVIIDV